jgi:hypothetical protein
MLPKGEKRDGDKDFFSLSFFSLFLQRGRKTEQLFFKLAFKTIILLVQKAVSKNRGWPEPSKFAHLYENLLANCPYKEFFDTASLCDPANADSVRQLTLLEGTAATSFFNATFRSARSRSGNNIMKLCCVVQRIFLPFHFV